MPLHLRVRDRQLFQFEGLSEAIPGAENSDHAATTGGEESSSLTSVLSNRSDWDEEDYESSDSSSSHEPTYTEKWEQLKAEFAFRDRILERVSRGKSEAFVELLRQHEREVRADERDRLLLGMLYDYDEKKGEEKKKEKDKLRKLLYAEKPKTSFLQNCREFAIFELNSTLPAVFVLVVYNLAHLGIYDAVTYFVDMAKKFVYNPQKQLNVDMVYLALFVIGVFFVRLSGYLYWWLRDQDYDCVKFDFHNRIRLGKLDARVLLWIKERHVLRAVVFMLGYYLSYIAVDYFQDRFVEGFFDQRKTLLKDLPSKKYDLNVCIDDLPPEVEGSSYSFSCQDEMEKRDEMYSALQKADDWYTWRVLSSDSYDAYWTEQLQDSDAAVTPLYGPTGIFLVYAVTTVLSIAILTAYGFHFFYKY